MTDKEVISRLIVKDGDLTVNTYQDVEAIIESNKIEQTAGAQKRDFRKIASIPLNIINIWLNEEWARGNTSLQMGGKEFDLLVQRKLADPDWRYLRTDK